MKKLKILLTLGSAVATFSFLNSAIQINQDAVNENFQQNISVKAFDRYTGNFYVGTGAANETYTIAKAGRTNTSFTGLAVGNSIGAVTSPNISLINEEANAEATLLAFQNNTAGDGQVQDLKVIRLNEENYPLFTVSRGAAADGQGYCLSNGEIATNFTKIAGGYKSGANTGGYIFIRTHPFQDGAQYSGILAYKKNAEGTALERIGVTGGNNPAAKLDNQRGVEGDGSFLRHESGRVSLIEYPVVTDMYWDDELETLFIAGNVSVANKPAEGPNYYLGLTQIKFDGANLKISDIIGNGVNAAANNNTTIFASTVEVGQSSLNVRMHKVRTMKTTTGRDYLIVNGSIQPNGTAHEFGNQFYALQYNRDTSLIVANDNAKTALIDGFARTGTDEVAANLKLDGGNVSSLVIGGKDAPWQAANESASDMEVVGDTVYVSFKNQIRNEDNDPGVWASSALFDNNGVIIGWTAWERVFASDPVNNVDYADMPYFFSVDGKTGQLWQVVEDYTTPAKNPRVVERTKITTSDFAATSLQVKINTDFADGCTCVLDLPKNTPGLGIADGATRNNSFVLFGGIEKVAFAQTKSGENLVTTDFTDFYIKTDLPSGAGVVRCLGYSRKALVGEGVATQGYFFAGTDKGLYVLAASADDHAGFDTTTNGGLTTMQAAPFTNAYEWQKMATNNITGAVSSIKSDGENIFVVEQDTTVKNSAISKIWKIELGDDVTTMEGATTKIAESGSAEIPPNAIITGLQLITNGTFGTHYGVISTNAGIYLSDQILSAIGREDNWSLVDGSKAYHSCYSPKRVPTVVANEDGANYNVWGIALADDDRGLEYYQNSTLQQFGHNHDVAITATPANFTNGNMATGTDRLTYIDRTTSFWTDGGRRFYTRFDARENINNSLRSLPYYAQEWAMTTPTVFTELSTISRIYWIENISGLGIVLAGTDDGVISLVE